jgi:hypothetical protein
MDHHHTPPANQQNLQHPAPEITCLFNNLWDTIVKAAFNFSLRCLHSNLLSNDNSSSITLLSPRKDLFNVQVDSASSLEAAICAASSTSRQVLTKQVILPSLLNDLECLWETSDYAREYLNWPVSPTPANFKIPTNISSSPSVQKVSLINIFHLVPWERACRLAVRAGNVQGKAQSETKFSYGDLCLRSSNNKIY